jgi:hypothetical protein
MPREDALSKGKRSLSVGRLLVHSVGDKAIRGTCRGLGKTYRWGWDWDGEWDGSWFCTCRTLRPTCSHIYALKLVTQTRGVSA